VIEIPFGFNFVCEEIEEKCGEDDENDYLK
jgi:hypothetical protein